MPGAIINADKSYLRLCLINLIENAQRHTPEGTSIHIDASEGGARVKIVVADNGPGVAEADRALISRRFMRAAL